MPLKPKGAKTTSSSSSKKKARTQRRPRDHDGAQDPRTRRRVVESEPKDGKAKKRAEHRGVATVISEGEIEIFVQMSELAPTGQYANVTHGPVCLRFITNNPGIERLGVVNWDDESPLTAEQQEIYDTLRGILWATSRVISDHINDDRELVLESVAANNAREAEEKSKAGGRRSKK
jgi:hypothetical protein